MTASEGAADAKPIEARWVLGDNPRVLYLPYVTPERKYQIKLDANLAAKSGAKLATAQTCEVESEAMPTSFYFASRGVVLPAGQNGGLPVVTVNTPEVDVQFLRVETAALPRFLEQVGGRRERSATAAEARTTKAATKTARRPPPQGHRRRLSAGRAARDVRTASTSAASPPTRAANRRNVNFLPVEKIKELQEPGIYVAVMSQPGRFGWDYQVTHYYVTDIGLHVRRHADAARCVHAPR